MQFYIKVITTDRTGLGVYKRLRHDLTEVQCT